MAWRSKRMAPGSGYVAVAATSIVLTGGGVRSAKWRQLVADICNLPVTVHEQDEGAAFGAALQAMQLLKRIATPKNHVNVLQHAMGYLKTRLDGDDKQELLETIEAYRQDEVPLIVPVTLLKHHFRRQPHPYIEQSAYFSPYPAELKLRNAV